jgi:hypothetical protein
MTSLLGAGAGSAPLRLLLPRSSTRVGKASQLAGMLLLKRLLCRDTWDMRLLPAHTQQDDRRAA